MSPQRRRTVAIVTAVAVAVAVVLVVVTVGIIPLPDLPTLAERPDPPLPAAIAYTQRDGGREAQQCLRVVEGADDREVTCLDEHVELVGWTADGDIAVATYGPGPPVRLEIDPASGRTVSRRRADHGSPPRRLPEAHRRDDGTELHTTARDGHAELLAVAADGTSRVLLALDGPRDYRLRDAHWAPGGAWVAVVDSADRLIVVRADGAPAPRVAAEDIADYAWSRSARSAPPGAV